MRKYASHGNDLRFSCWGVVMALAALKGRKHLSADALFRLVRSGFTTIPDHRGGETAISLTDTLMAAFAMFSLKSPSLLAFDKERAEDNLATIYGIARVPCDTQMRELLDPVCPASLRPLFKGVFRQLQRGKALEAMVLFDDCYLAGTRWHGVFCLSKRFTARHVCNRSTATEARRILIKCWARRLSIRTCGQ